MWGRLAPLGIFQLCGGSQEAATAHLGTAEARRQGLGAEPVVTTDYLGPGGCFQSSVSKGESWSQRLGPLVGEEKAGQASGTSSCPPEQGPSTQRKPGRGADSVVVSLYRGRQAHVGTLAGC